MTKDSANTPDEDAAYVAPVVEDLDSGKGPVETAVGVIAPSFPPGTDAAPRDF